MWNDASVSEAKWFAVRVRTNHEKVVTHILEDKEVEPFLPSYRQRRPWSDRIKELDRPLFPGYVFCRFALEASRLVLMTPGVMHLVGTGRTPAAIPDCEIDNLRRFVASEIQSMPHPFLHVGQRVRIERGPLAGVEGVLKEFKSGYRLVVSVTLLQRAVAVELDGSWIEAISNALGGASDR